MVLRINSNKITSLLSLVFREVHKVVIIIIFCKASRILCRHAKAVARLISQIFAHLRNGYFLIMQ